MPKSELTFGELVAKAEGHLAWRSSDARMLRGIGYAILALAVATKQRK